MSTKPAIAIVGADGFVGGGLAAAIDATRITYGVAENAEVHIAQAGPTLRDADIVINAGGFRVRPGCSISDYRRSHEGAASALVPHLRQGTLLIHISSASVLGKSRTEKLGPRTQPNPAAFPSCSYAVAKFETEQFLTRAASERGFRVIFLRPALVYGRNGTGMIESLIKLAKRRIGLRLYPRTCRHHLCHMNLLVEVARRVIDQRPPHLSSFVVAEPYTVTNRELEAVLAEWSPRPRLTFPIPVGWLKVLLQNTFHSRNPVLDLKTWAEICGVLKMDTVYDPSDTFRALGIDPSHYSIEKTLRPLIKEAFRQ